MRPPSLSLLFFASVIGCFAWAAYEKRLPARDHAVQLHDKAQSPTQDQRSRITAAAQQWPETPSYDFHVSALDPAFDLTASTGGQFDPTDDYWGLPRSNGYEEVSAYCGACHSLSIVMQQRATPERWRELLQWMVDKQGMAPLEPDVQTTIQAYLNEHFSTQ